MITDSYIEPEELMNRVKEKKYLFGGLAMMAMQPL